MSSAFLPAPFRGLYTEDSREWIETATWYVQAQRAPTELQKIALVGILLLDDAKRWLLGLRIENAPADGHPPDGAITTFNQFKEAFLQRFQRDQANLWREQALIWQCRQKPGQGTQAFLNELQEIAGRARATQEQILTAAIAGLRDDVKTFCLSHELGDIQELQRWANVYELCSGSKSDAVDSTVARLEKALEKLQVRAASPAPRPASPLGRQVRFPDRPVSPVNRGDADRRSPGRSTGRGWGSGQGRASDGWGFGQDQAPGNWGYGGARGRRGGGPRFQGQPGRFYFDQFGSPKSPPQFQGKRPRPQFYYGRRNDDGAQSCRNCGRYHPWGQCPARNSTCRSCDRPGHWSSVCRSSAPQQ